MRVSLFDIDLPADRIALRPARPRDAARKLVVPEEGEFLFANGGIRHLVVLRALPDAGAGDYTCRQQHYI